MILIDVNILLYAHAARFTQHAAARSWFDAQLNGAAQVGLPWHSILGFMRLVTNPRVLPRPEASIDAWAQVRAWLSNANVWVPLPTERHADVLGDLIRKTGAAADLIPDAHLAALSIEHGLTLCSADGDFARFPGLRWLNPLQP